MTTGGAIDASALLRPGLLEGVSVLVAGPTEWVGATGPVGATRSAEAIVLVLDRAVSEVFMELGARLHRCAPDATEEAVVDETVTAAVAESGSLEMLVVDGAGLFAQGGLRACLDATWNVTRAVANHAFLTSGEPAEPRQSEPRKAEPHHAGRGYRRIVYLAPRPNAGEQADAARAGLENLGRTLSTEWARYGITVVTIAPGDGTPAGEVAALCAYLASPACAYFSGCLLDLRGP
jgi:NAD(P)-dependent dehydrogenase (short-subunit alcohol dehydrogenase family)